MRSAWKWCSRPIASPGEAATPLDEPGRRRQGAAAGAGGLTAPAAPLTEKLTGCPKAKSSASAAAKKPKTRKLWGDGKGKFRTKGKYSAATVRGTKWLVKDTCTTTTTTVTQGVVQVEDFAKKRKVTVRKGAKPYVARKK